MSEFEWTGRFCVLYGEKNGSFRPKQRKIGGDVHGERAIRVPPGGGFPRLRDPAGSGGGEAGGDRSRYAEVEECEEEEEEGDGEGDDEEVGEEEVDEERAAGFLGWSGALIVCIESGKIVQPLGNDNTHVDQENRQLY